MSTIYDSSSTFYLVTLDSNGLEIFFNVIYQAQFYLDARPMISHLRNGMK